MTENIRYPFKLKNTFFINLEFKREPDITPGTLMQFELQIKVTELNFPEFQINMINTTRSGSPIKLSLESVAIFEYKGENSDQFHETVHEFITKEGFTLLWPYTAQMIRIITGQMGMDPLRIPIALYVDALHKIEPDKVDGLS